MTLSGFFTHFVLVCVCVCRFFWYAGKREKQHFEMPAAACCQVATMKALREQWAFSFPRNALFLKTAPPKLTHPPLTPLNALGGGTLCPGKSRVAMESQRQMLDRRVKSSGPWPAAGGLYSGTMFLGCLKVPSFRYASRILVFLAEELPLGMIQWALKWSHKPVLFRVWSGDPQGSLREFQGVPIKKGRNVISL